MTRKVLPPIQREVEKAERDLYENGDIVAVATLEDVSESLVSRQLNQDEPQHRSPFYVFLRRLYYADQNREELGDGYIALLLRYRGRWLNRQDSDAIPSEVPASMFSFLKAAVEQLPYTVQMKYLDEAYLTLDKFKRGLQMDGIEDSEPNDNVKHINRK